MKIRLALSAGSDGYRNLVGTAAGYFDNRLRTDNGTGGTTCAVIIVRLSGEIAISVGYFGDDDRLLGAYDYTQAAALASFGVDNDHSSHLNTHIACYCASL